MYLLSNGHVVLKQQGNAAPVLACPTSIDLTSKKYQAQMFVDSFTYTYSKSKVSMVSAPHITVSTGPSNQRNQMTHNPRNGALPLSHFYTATVWFYSLHLYLKKSNVKNPVPR